MKTQKNKLLKTAAYFFPLLFILLSILPVSQTFYAYAAEQKSTYFPERGVWEKRKPEELGLDSQKLQEAIDFALANEYSGPKDLRIAILEGFQRDLAGDKIFQLHGFLIG